MSGTLIIVAIAAVLVAVAGLAMVLWFSRKSQSDGVTPDIDQLLVEGRYDAARDISVSALSVETNPEECFELRIRLARALAGQEDYQAAARVCREAAEYAPRRFSGRMRWSSLLVPSRSPAISRRRPKPSRRSLRQRVRQMARAGESWRSRTSLSRD